MDRTKQKPMPVMGIVVFIAFFMLVIVVVTTSIVQGMHHPVRIDVGDGVFDRLFLRNTFAPETTDEHAKTFRWSSPDTTVLFYIPTTHALLTMQLYGSDSPRSGSHALTIQQHQHTVATIAVASGWRTYHVLVRGVSHATHWYSTSRTFSLVTPDYCPPYYDSRVLGVPVDSIALTPLQVAPQHMVLPTMQLVLALATLPLALTLLLPPITQSIFAHHRRRVVLFGMVMIFTTAGVAYWARHHIHTLLWSVYTLLPMVAAAVLLGWGIQWLISRRHVLQRFARIRVVVVVSGVVTSVSHVLLLSNVGLSVTWHGMAAWGILLLPGFLLALIWCDAPHAYDVLHGWLERLFLAVCGAIAFPLLLLLAWQPLQVVVPLHAWGVIVLCDAVSLAAGWFLWHIPLTRPTQPIQHNHSLPPHYLYILLIIVVIGGVLRYWQLGTAEFEGDEARAMLLAIGGIFDHKSDLLLLHKKGPVEILLPMAPMTLTGTINEWVIRFPLALASTTTLIGVYVLAVAMATQHTNHITTTRRFAQAGLFAAALLAVDGFLVAYARILQYQSIVMMMLCAAVVLMVRFAAATPLSLLDAQRLLSGAALFTAVALLAHYDGMFGVPVLLWLFIRGGVRHRWQFTTWMRLLWLPLLIGGGIVLGFYVPFMLHENFRGTVAYLGQRAGEHSALLVNNLPGYYTIATFYNTTMQMQWLGGVCALACGVWLIRYARPRRVRLVSALLWMSACLLIVAAPDMLQYSPALNLAPLLCVPPLLMLLLSPATPAPLRTTLFWFAPPFIAEAFIINDPRTHFYTMDVALALLVGIALSQSIAWLYHHRLRVVSNIVYGSHIVVILIGAGYMWLVFVRQMPEYKRMYPIAKPAWYNPPYGDKLPGGGHYGHPHRDGWKVIGELYRQHVLQGDYYSNQMERISAWYTHGAYRCSNAPSYYLLGTWAASESDMAIPTNDIRTTYTHDGCVVVDNMNILDIYRHPSVAGAADAPHASGKHTPTVFHLREYVHQFDAQPLTRFPIQQAVMQPVPQVRKTVQWQHGVTLLGYDIYQQMLPIGGETTLTLTWHTTQALDVDTSLVVQVVRQQQTATKGGQHDDTQGYVEPLCGMPMPATWHTQGVVSTSFRIVLPSALYTGDYDILVGLRHRQEWLPLVAHTDSPNTNDVQQDGLVSIGTVTVQQ